MDRLRKSSKQLVPKLEGSQLSGKLPVLRHCRQSREEVAYNDDPKSLNVMCACVQPQRRFR